MQIRNVLHPHRPIRSMFEAVARRFAHEARRKRPRSRRGAPERRSERASGLALLVAALLVIPFAETRAAEPDAIVGRWQTEDEDGNRDSIVEISRVGEAYVGRVVWVKYAVYPDDDPRGWAGRPVVDRENPDPALRTRSLLGVDVLKGLRFDGEGWGEGEIYSPRKGTTYAARAWLEAAETLKIRGYVGTPWLGRTVTWRRAPAGGDS